MRGELCARSRLAFDAGEKRGRSCPEGDERGRLWNRSGMHVIGDVDAKVEEVS